MPYGVKLIAAPTVEPVSVDDAKRRLRVDGSDEDLDIAAMIAEAREMAEDECGRAFVSQTWSLFLDDFPRGLPANRSQDRVYDANGFSGGWAWSILEGWSIRIPRPPLLSVTYVKYFDPDGVLQTVSPANYIVAQAGEPARIAPAPGQWWPSIQVGRPECVEVRFVAGFGATAAEVPAVAKAAIHEILAHRWMNRGDEAKSGIPATARRLLHSLEYGGGA